jgi:hypothetical protein
MNADSSSAISGLKSGSIGEVYAVSMMRKARDAQRLQGEAAVRLIDASAAQMTKTADGHISVRA